MTTTIQPVLTDIEYFESIYAGAEGDASRVPWADSRPHPALITWLNAIAPSLVRCGARVAVVGCGLGDDARELMARGYEVTAFDCSATAVQWCRRTDPAHSGCYAVADLFDLPARWRHRFDLVVEINTIQSLLPEMHAEALGAIANLLSPRGHLLVICRGAEQPVSLEDGPPWALTEQELLEAAAIAGLSAAEAPVSFDDDESPPVRRIRAVFARA
jgi:SAM-dependent methyltransferase